MTRPAQYLQGDPRQDMTANDSPISAMDPRAVSRDVFAAAIGSLCCCYSGQPLDIVKVKMQTRPQQYTSMLPTAASLLQQEGLLAFWKGSVPTAMGMMGESVVAFGINAALVRTFPDQPSNDPSQDSKPNLLKPFLLGPVTGCSAALVLCPAEVVKAKTQVGIAGTCPRAIARQMIQQGGLKSMFSGLDGQFMRDGFFYTLFFGGYEVCKYGFRTAFPSMPDELNFYLSGGIAGMAGWAVAIPFDVPKTVVQAKWDTRVFGDYFPTMLRIARERGIRRGLYQGLGPALGRAFIANSALFLGVEMGKRYFDNQLWKAAFQPGGWY